MLNQFSILLTIYVTFSHISQSSLQSVKCDYSIQWFWRNGHVPINNNSYYTCYLDTRNTEFRPTYIEGQHSTGRTDNDVEHIIAYKGKTLATLTSIYCEKFKNIEVFKIDTAQMAAIDENALQNCKTLKYFAVDGNNLRALPEYLLIRNPKLKHIWLQKNQLVTLSENFFLNQRELTTLELYFNQISYLPPKIFKSLVGLRELHISENRLQVLDLEWFTNTVNLEYLSLNGNQITSIPPNVFKSLNRLQITFIYGNRIRTLYPQSFVGLYSLKTLALFKNEISDLPQGVFAPLTSIEELSLHFNKLTTVHSDSFAIHGYLKKLYFEHNSIISFDEKIIDNTAVETLNMTNNVCSSFITGNRNEIKSLMSNCFRNYQPRFRSVPQIVQRPVSNNQQSPENSPSSGFCGRPIKAQGNIIGGSRITQGAFPW